MEIGRWFRKSEFPKYGDWPELWHWYEPIYTPPPQLVEYYSLRNLALKMESIVLQEIRKERSNGAT